MCYEVYDSCNNLVGKNKWPDESMCCGCFDHGHMHHGHGGRMHNGWRVLLLFGESELKYDISNVAYAQGDIARVNDKYGHDLLGDNEAHYIHQWMDICEDGNYDRVKRTIALALSECEHMLHRYVAKRLHMHTSIENQRECIYEYPMEMLVPRTFAESTVWYIMRLIHEYVIDRVLEDWANVAYPEVAQVWMNKRLEIADKLHNAKTICGENHVVKPSII